MHESRMMAEVAPPGVCAMPKVSGSRIATPFAPPSPGSTPMITPRITPVNISARFLSDIATPKPWISDWISSISAQAQQRFDRSFRERHLEPDLEDQVEHDHRGDADDEHLPPRVASQPAHEERDEENRRKVDPDPRDERDVDRARDQHREHHAQLAHQHERLVSVALAERGAREVHQRRDADDQPDIEREIAGARAVG